MKPLKLRRSKPLVLVFLALLFYLLLPRKAPDTAAPAASAQQISADLPAIPFPLRGLLKF